MLRLGEPFEEGHRGPLPLRGGADGTEARAPLHHQLFSVFKHRAGPGDDGDVLRGVVRIGHHIAVIEDAGRGGHADDAVAGADRLGGVPALEPDAALQGGPGQEFPCRLEGGAEGQLIPMEEVLAQGLGSYLEVVEVVVVNEHGLGIPRNIRRLVVGPVRVDLRSPVKPLPCIQILNRYTGSLGEAVEDGLVDEHDLCGFGHRQHHQTAIDRPLLQKGWEEGGQLLLAEIVPVVHQNAVVGQGHHRLGIGYEKVGQLRSSRLSVGGCQHQLVNDIGVGHGGDLHIDLLLFSHRLVELIDQIVERRIGLPAIHVPYRNGNRRFFFIHSV